MSTEILTSTWEEFAQVLFTYQRFLVSSHIHPDGDAVGSALAFKRLAEKLGKQVTWVMDDDPGEMFSNFYHTEEVTLFNPEAVDYSFHEVMVMTDASIWKRLGRVGTVMESHPGPKLCVDHHQSLDSFPGVKLHDVNSPSTTVIMHRLLKYLDMELTLDIAEPIYLGMIVDTQNFHLPNTTEEAHLIAAECLRAGVRPQKVYEPVYGTLHFSRMKLMSEAFKTVQIHCDGKVGVMYTTQQMFKEAAARKSDDEGFSDLIRTIEGVQVGIYLREAPDGSIKVSWRAKGNNNVEISARRFGGGGHIRASGALFRGKLENVLQIVVKDMEDRVAKGEIV